jgi:hypothetical protein
MSCILVVFLRKQLQERSCHTLHGGELKRRCVQVQDNLIQVLIAQAYDELSVPDGEVHKREMSELTLSSG